MTRSRGRGLRRPIALVAGMALLAGACGYHKDSTVVRLDDPGRCVPVDVAASPATAQLLDDTAGRFNESPDAKFRDGSCAFVRVETVESAVALHELQDGWPDADRIGPAPVVWVPESTMWGRLLDARTPQGLPPPAPNGTSFARTPLVIAMPAPMASALGAGRRALGWADLRQLAANPRGWGAYGHREWGRFRLGKGNPNWSATGLDQTVAVDAAPGLDPRALEQSVIYYGDTSVYFDNWTRLAAQAPARALAYCSAVITDERSVVAYNTGHDLGATTVDGDSSRPALPLVAIYPRDAAIESDNPMIVLNASWSSSAARAGAERFIRFALQPQAQAEVAAAGFRPVRAGVPSTVLTRANGVDPAAGAPSVAPASPAEIEHALARWQSTRRAARVLVLFDLSDSMGDPADPMNPGGPSKLAVAKAAFTAALGELGPDDEIGLRVFSTGIPGSTNPNWRDVVPMGRIATNRHRLVNAIAALEPSRGSPLYRATSGAFDAQARSVDPRRIDSVVLLTDGYNEDEHDTDLGALLQHLSSRADIRVFTITYGNDADATTLVKIADATNAANFDARDARDLAEMARRALASQ